MKITTEMCVEFARKLPAYANTLPSQWKRRSKKKTVNGILRTFEVNWSNHVEIVNILEKNGQLSILQSEPPSNWYEQAKQPSNLGNFIFAISPYLPEFYNFQVVIFDLKQAFHSNHKQSNDLSKVLDKGTAEAFNQFIKENGLQKVVGNLYKTVDSDPATIVKKLTTAGVPHDSQFQDFINKYAKGIRPDAIVQYPLEAQEEAPTPVIPVTKPSAGGSPLYLKLKANPITVNLKNFDWSELDGRKKSEFTGRVVYGANDEPKEVWNTKYYNEYGFAFLCGPEEKGGALEDTLDLGCYQKLNELFADFPEETVSIGAAENYHEIEYIPELTFKELFEIVKERLERSGAVHPKGW